MSLPDKIKRESKSRNERNDCALKAVSIVANHPYADVHERMAANGRRRRCGVRMSVIFKVLRGLNVWYENVQGPWTKSRMRTPVRFVKHYLPRKGRFLVVTSSHILAVVNGEVLDWTAQRNHPVVAVYEITF